MNKCNNCNYKSKSCCLCIRVHYQTLKNKNCFRWRSKWKRNRLRCWKMKKKLGSNSLMGIRSKRMWWLKSLSKEKMMRKDNNNRLRYLRRNPLKVSCPHLNKAWKSNKKSNKANNKTITNAQYVSTHIIAQCKQTATTYFAQSVSYNLSSLIPVVHYAELTLLKRHRRNNFINRL